MVKISIQKVFFFNLLKKNKFVNSLFFTKNCLKEISEEIEKKNSFILKFPISEQIVKIFFNQFNLIKLNWKKLKGGHTRKKYLKELEDKYLNLSVNDFDVQNKLELLESNFGKYKNNFFNIVRYLLLSHLRFMPNVLQCFYLFCPVTVPLPS